MAIGFIRWNGPGYYAGCQEGKNFFYQRVNGENPSQRSRDAKNCVLGTPSFYQSIAEFRDRTSQYNETDESVTI